MCMLLLVPVPLGVTVKYDQENYTVHEEAGSVTLALVLEGDGEAINNTSVPVTVTVRTLDLLNSSYGDAATGELLEFCLLMPVWPDAVCNEFVKGFK